jgi:hypothetical protein
MSRFAVALRWMLVSRRVQVRIVTQQRQATTHDDIPVTPQMRAEVAPPAGYRCLLDSQPDTWAPRDWRPEGVPAAGDCIVNPSLRFSESGELQGERAAFSAAVSTDQPTAWVSDAASRVLAPFALSPGLASQVRALEPGAPLPSSLPPEVLARLHSAGIVGDLTGMRRQRDQWLARIDQATLEFHEGYAALGQLLHPFTLAAARVYFRRLIRQRRAHLGDGQSPRRWIVHNEPVARFFHHQFTPIVAKVAGVEVKPSYVYFSCYDGGADLEWHTDRKQCEFSLSMLLDYSPRPAAESPWPLLLHTSSGRIAVHQRIGESLAYRGGEIPHARERLPLGHASMHLFLHYVPIHFEGELD